MTTGGKPAGNLSITTTHGDVALTFAAKALPNKASVSTEHGDVTLSLPPNGGFQIDAGTREGDISSDFDAVKVSQTSGASSANGTVGNGLSKLRVNTDTGDIKIVKS